MFNRAEEANEIAFLLYDKTGNVDFALAAFDFAERNKARILSDELRWNLSICKASEQDTLVLRERKLMQALAYYEGERIQAELSNHEQERQRFKKEASRIG